MTGFHLILLSIIALGALCCCKGHRRKPAYPSRADRQRLLKRIAQGYWEHADEN